MSQERRSQYRVRIGARQISCTVVCSSGLCPVEILDLSSRGAGLNVQGDASLEVGDSLVLRFDAPGRTRPLEVPATVRNKAFQRVGVQLEVAPAALARLDARLRSLFNERRTRRLVPDEYLLVFVSREDEEDPAAVRLRDLCLEGAGLADLHELDRPLELGEEVEVLITLGDEDNTVFVPAEVCHWTDGDHPIAGVRFLNISERERRSISGFLLEKLGR